MISQLFVVMEEIENVWLAASRGEAWWLGWKMGWAMGVVHPTGAVRGAGPRGGAGKGEDYVSIGRRWTGAGRGMAYEWVSQVLDCGVLESCVTTTRR